MTIYSYTALAVAGLAAGLDLKTHKIPNWLTFSATAVGLCLYLYLQGTAGLLSSVKGLLLGLVVFIIPFALGGMGGGYVKLLGALGAVVGVWGIIEVALFGALWGGLLSLLAILVKRKPAVLRRFSIGLKMLVITQGRAGKEFMLPGEDVVEQERVYVPYGLAIFLGVVTSLLVDILP